MEDLRSAGLITTNKAAELLECTVQHVRLLIREGRIEGVRAGRDWLALTDSIAAYDSERKAKPQLTAIKEPPQLETLFPDLEFAPAVNVASVPQRSPFRYPGGKTWLIPLARAWMASFPLGTTRLLEPFAGGAGISLAAVFERFVELSELVELDADVAVVWRVIFEGCGTQLCDRIRTFRFNVDSVNEILQSNPTEQVDQAFRTIIRNRASRGGILAQGAGLVKTGEAGKGIASRWYPETLAKRILAIDQLRHQFRLTEGDGIRALQGSAEDRRTAHFVDPPYPVAGRRLYSHHELDHEALFGAMQKCRGPLLATYDNNPFIESLARQFGFQTRLVPMKSTHHERKLELLISRDFSWLPESATAR
ncbi:MAG: hypothetical protein JNJ45_04805 [Chthonomonas sp.]|nr:hypothetical protein [Chthonomonas sp.]